jgi:hypothetical protein
VQYCSFASFTSPTDIRALVASLSGFNITADNVPSTGLDSDKVKRRMTKLAVKFFSAKLDRDGDRVPDAADNRHITVTATDDLDPAPTVLCTPSAGSLFAIGDTRVECVATDAGGNTTDAGFLVTVLGAKEQLAQLVAKVIDANQPARRGKDTTDREAAIAQRRLRPERATAAQGRVSRAEGVHHRR